VDFGTVAPAFEQAGGGVEAYFANAVTNGMVPLAPVVKVSDVWSNNSATERWRVR
jgi:hypothetical protein